MLFCWPVNDVVVIAQGHEGKNSGREKLKVAVEYNVSRVFIQSRGLNIQQGRVATDDDLRGLEVQETGKVRHESNQSHDQRTRSDARSEKAWKYV